MGCAKSKGARRVEEPSVSLVGDVGRLDQEPEQARQDSGEQLTIPIEPQTCAESDKLVPKTPMAPVDDSVVTFDRTSHSEIDTAMQGEARAKSALRFQGSCFSSAEVSASSSRRGVAFRVEPSFVVVGLKAAPGKADDSYSALDYAFYCMEHGRVQIYEAGEVKHTHRPKYTEDSQLEIHLRAHPHAVEYLIDNEVVYKSLSTPPKSLHFQICFGDHPAVVSDACFVMTSEH